MLPLGNPIGKRPVEQARWSRRTPASPTASFSTAFAAQLERWAEPYDTYTMSKIEPLFCSKQCEETELNRSFKACGLCGKRWDGKANDFYCNTAWKNCINCSNEKKICVVCGDKIIPTG